MPKLSKTRIINLNYNDGKRTIYNEIFDYGSGKDTLFSMENGIGKTVLIQFFMQPFLRNKRELQGRKFEDYFSSTPTYIMHEVLLDNGEKLLVGMLIKKDTSDDEKNRLRILTFTNKYSKPNEFDIINAPFVEDKRILSFSECENKIKKYKSGKLHFKYYNFMDSSKKAEYFEDLKSYKLDYKEWEDIIRSINNDESGLSNLYDKHKTDEALIRNVIIPLIESKINGENNAIETIRKNLAKYIESYKQSKESLHEVELLKAFRGDMEPVSLLLKEGMLKEDNRESLYKRLSHIALLCEKELAKKSREKLHHEEFVEYLNGELTRVDYEEHSLNYYHLQSQEEKARERLEEVREDHRNKELKKEELVREKYIQECAEIYQELLAVENSLTEARERIANYEREDTEIAQNIRNYKFTLKNLYQQELEDLEGKENDLLNRQAKAKGDMEKNEAELKANGERKEKTIRGEEAVKSRIANFEKTESEFKKKYADFKAIRNILLNEYNEKELDEYSQSIDDSIKSNKTRQETLNLEADSLIKEKTALDNEIKSANENLTQKKLELNNKNNALKLFNKETTKIIEILAVKNLPLDPAGQREKLRDVINSESIRLQDALVNEEERRREIRDTVQRYETGLIQLPKEVLQSFENKGIQFEYALNWLQNYQGSKEEKEGLIENNPFFPYAIILSTKDINLLKNETLDVFTSIPIPIINKSDLNKVVPLDKSNDVLTVQNQDFLVSFNDLLIDEEERAELLKDLRREIEGLSSDIKKTKSAIDRNKEYGRILTDYPYHGDEDAQLKTDITSLEQEIEDLDTLLKQDSEKLKGNENRRSAITQEVHDLEKKQIFLADKKGGFNQFVHEHQDFKKNNRELYKYKTLAEELAKEEAELKKLNADLQESLRKLYHELYEVKRSIGECFKKIDLYKTVERGILIDEDKNSIEAKLKACEKELSGNIQRDKDAEKDLIEKLRNSRAKLIRKAKDGRLIKEYEEALFSVELLEELTAEIDVLAKEIKDLDYQIHRLDKEVSIILTKKQRELEDIEKLGFNTPIAKESIKDADFKGRRIKINEDLKQNQDIIKGYMEEINQLNSLMPELKNFKSYLTDLEEADFNFNNLSAAIKTVENDLKSYDGIKTEIYKTENKISREISDIYEKYRDQNRLIQDRLKSFLSKERKIAGQSDIESLLEVVGRMIRTLELELSSIKSEEEVMINEILRYTTHVLQELKTIDKKSSIKHLGKTQKLLEISIPDEKEEETLKEYIKEKVQYYAYFDGDYGNHLDSDIQSAELLSRLIGNISRIRVDIKKIEKSGLVRKSWKEALSQNSGGEKFVSMFILLSSLMSYMRRRETEIDNREEKKILIMDNPFAKTNAGYLLEPMFQIAEKYNIQLICFSGIGGSAVYNRFNKIYVAKVIEDRFRNKENVAFKAGNEETLELSDFTITKQQISMF